MKGLVKRINQLERTPWTPLDREIQNLMLALLDMGTTTEELQRIIDEVKP